ncbi:MAG TPA: hypothetical protein VGV38_20275, partial [Pyrinomonadaceae bacterium]|nr:hypothetical protein [Pyrinomonadaceae bacterium]
FYPGYWDSWPSLQGAAGMTYETDGGGWKGLRWKRDDDTIVTFRSAIAKHFVASLTTLETAARNAQARLTDFYRFKTSALEEGRTGRVKRFVILPGRDPGRAAELVENLLRAGVEVGVTGAPFRSARAHDYSSADSPAASREFPAGSYVVNLAQPQKRVAKALLEPDTPQDEEFSREQVARFQRNQRRGRSAPKEQYGFYDVTAWALPYAFGVETFWTEDAPEVSLSPVRLEQSGGGEQVGGRGLQWPASLRAGGVTGRAHVAYVIPYERNGAASLVARLLREDFKLAVTTKQLNAGGRDWPRGTVVVRVSRNPESLHQRIAELAQQTGTDVFAVNTGFSERGETGVGSETVVSLKRPRIVVVADEPVSVNSYGAMWWLFDRYGVDFTPMTVSALRNARLDQYNVVILPDGSPGRYMSMLGKPGVDALRAWVERGGTLVCIKGAAVFAALKDVSLTSARLVGSDEDEPADKKPDDSDAQAQASPSPSPEQTSTSSRTGARARQGVTPDPQSADAAQTEKMEGAPPDLPPIASPSARPGRVPEAVPGAIFRATVDRSTPLTYGYEQTTLPVLVDSGYFFRPSKEGTNAVVFDADSSRPLRLAGFIWPGNTEQLLRGTAYVIEEPTGSGHVVLYAEDPNFRAIWRSTTRLFFNSFLFQTAF